MKIPRNVKKAFLIASYMGSVLKYYKEGRPVLSALHMRIDNGMQRYCLIAGRREYHGLANSGSDIWERLSTKHHTKLSLEETEIFVELLGSLLSPKDHQDFLAMEHFTTKVKTDDEKYSKMCHSVLDLNDEVNELLGTKSVVHSVIKPKPKKEKRERDKSKKSKSEIRESKAKIKEAERKAKARNFLRDKIAKARGE